MSTPAVVAPQKDSRGLASSLEPILLQACAGRLSPIRWFRADWQRGGAATGTATWRGDEGAELPVVVKLPVATRELLWTRRLNDAVAKNDPVVPRLYAAGEELGGYDLAWLVIERLPFGPLGTHWMEGHIERIADAAARFALTAGRFPTDGEAIHEPWDAELDDALRNIRINQIPEDARWTKAIKALRRGLDGLVVRWDGAPTEWIHGDLHLANAMSRASLEAGPVCLIDLAEVRPGHWIEDAVYLERQLWARPERMQGQKPVKAVAAARKACGLPVEVDYAELAMIRRALLAATAPKFIRSEGNPRHLGACLQWLETALNELR